MEDDTKKSPTLEELETLLGVAGVGAGAAASRIGVGEIINPFDLVIV